MKAAAAVRCLFLDIGGVLLSDGWDHRARTRAAATFDLQRAEMEARHQLTFETYEDGSLTLDEYLDLVVFHRTRPFTRAAFRRFMFAQSTPHPRMLALVPALKARGRLKIIVVSNEGRELNAHRIHKFKLEAFVDAFVSSCFVHLRKPDPRIFSLALDIAQTPVEQVVYVENTPMFVGVAGGLGIRGIIHTGYESTRAMLTSLGCHP